MNSGVSDYFQEVVQLCIKPAKILPNEF